MIIFHSSHNLAPQYKFINRAALRVYPLFPSMTINILAFFLYENPQTHPHRILSGKFVMLLIFHLMVPLERKFTVRAFSLGPFLTNITHERRFFTSPHLILYGCPKWWEGIYPLQCLQWIPLPIPISNSQWLSSLHLNFHFAPGRRENNTTIENARGSLKLEHLSNAKWVVSAQLKHLLLHLIPSFAFDVDVRSNPIMFVGNLWMGSYTEKGSNKLSTSFCLVALISCTPSCTLYQVCTL